MIDFEFGRLPDPKWHALLSFIKSGFRIAAGISLIFSMFILTGILLIVAELIGIAEELV